MEANRQEESREAILGAGLGVLFFLFIANVVFAVIGALGYEEGLTDFLGHMLMAAYAAIVLRLGFAERNYLVPGVLLLAAEAAAFVSVYVIRSSPAWLIVPAAIVSAAGRALEFGALVRRVRPLAQAREKLDARSGGLLHSDGRSVARPHAARDAVRLDSGLGRGCRARAGVRRRRDVSPLQL